MVVTIELTDEVRQDPALPIEDDFGPVAYMVFHGNGEEHVFIDYRDAESFANTQMDDCNDGTSSWTIFPLYAARGHEVEF